MSLTRLYSLLLVIFTACLFQNIRVYSMDDRELIRFGKQRDDSDKRDNGGDKKISQEREYLDEINLSPLHIKLLAAILENNE